ncbi:MAG: SDR family NAD(P)-dependent oxidoreductase [Acidimicrobiia bacterium]
MSPFDLRGHTSIVTGGNRGIGLGLASGLVGAGAEVVIWGRDADRNHAAVARLGGPGAVTAVACDVSSEDDVGAALEATLQRHGKVDSLFVNAGTTGAVTFPDLGLDEWRRVMAVNLDGAFLTARAVADIMMVRGRGSIVFTASVASRLGMPYNPHYAATKGGVRQLARSLAVRLARFGIRVNILSPGFVETELTEDLKSEERFDRAVATRTPMGRWGRPDDFGGAAVFLAGDASPYMTGAEMVIDGGFTIF